MSTHSKATPPEVTRPRFQKEASDIALQMAQFSVDDLMRPFDAIRPYRLEGDVVLSEPGDRTLFTYWQQRLTDTLIADVKQAGGTLCNLASEEMKGLFDWKRVEREVRIVTPEFRVRKNGKLTTVVIYTKMCRGEMTRFILKNEPTNPEALRTFTWEGFRWDETLSDNGRMIFVL
jgi:cytoplasmic iron level regulating protein YaaA (DUF328/UPF0246 family)